MNERLSYYLNLISQVGVLALAAITPLLFWNLTSEFYETPKFLFLIAVVALLLVLWAIRWITEGKVTFTRTPLDLPFLLLLIVLLISTAFTPAKTAAIFGNLPRIHGGLAAFAVYLITYFVLVSSMQGAKLIPYLTRTLIFSGTILSILSLLSYAGINFLTLPWTSALNFTPSGSSFSTVSLLTLTLPFILFGILQHNGNYILGGPEHPDRNTKAIILVNKVFLTIILTLFATTILLIGSLATFVAGGLAYGLSLFVVSPSLIRKGLPFITIPIVVAVLLALLSFVPLGGSRNIFYTQAQNFPRELQLPVDISWKVSISTFRDFPFWGSGPGSYLFDFTAYKPIEFNSFTFWNIRFDQAFNEYLQLLATLGSTGLIALLFLTTTFMSLAVKAIGSHRNSINLPLSISGITFFILLALHPSTLLLWVTGILILAAFMANSKDLTRQLQIGSSSTHPALSVSEGRYLHLDVLPALAMLVVLAIVGGGLYAGSKFALAEYHHRHALNAVASGQGLLAYNELVAAEELNPSADLYRSELAQTNFALANAIASAKGPTEASPSGSLTDADKQDIQTLLSQAINEGKAATTLSPNNPANWEVLAAIYRQISGVAQNALAFSLDSYGHAIARDPLNPALRLAVGGIYYSARNYDMAIRFFSDAANIKPDYANAYYNLAVALKDKGDLVSAASSAERTVSLLDPKNADYKTASDLLAGLKEQIAKEKDKTQATPSATLKEEAPKKPSALQSNSLPKVLNLPQPENVATPPAVKKQTQE